MKKNSQQRRERPRDADAAREQCLRLLSLRARSTAELRQRLLREGYEPDDIAGVLAALTESGLLDDADFARSWVTSRQPAGIGPHRLQAELGRKGVPREMIAAALAAHADEEMDRAAAARMARKRLGKQVADRPSVARVRRFLLARGYGHDLVDNVLRSITGDEALE